MRTVIAIVLALAILSVCGGCSNHARRSAMINHAVYIKLKNPADADTILADGECTLKPIPEIASYTAGKRLAPARPNVDETFDVGFIFGFKSVEDYEAYLHNPAHVAAVEKWKPRWESIKICDVIDPTP